MTDKISDSGRIFHTILLQGLVLSNTFQIKRYGAGTVWAGPRVVWAGPHAVRAGSYIMCGWSHTPQQPCDWTALTLPLKTCKRLSDSNIHTHFWHFSVCISVTLRYKDAVVLQLHIPDRPLGSKLHTNPDCNRINSSPSALTRLLK